MKARILEFLACLAEVLWYLTFALLGTENTDEAAREIIAEIEAPGGLDFPAWIPVEKRLPAVTFAIRMGRLALLRVGARLLLL